MALVIACHYHSLGGSFTEQNAFELNVTIEMPYCAGCAEWQSSDPKCLPSFQGLARNLCKRAGPRTRAQPVPSSAMPDSHYMMQLSPVQYEKRYFLSFESV